MSESGRLLPAQINTKQYDLTGRQKELVDFALMFDHGQSEFKTRYFVGNAQITPYQKYKQYLLELRAREEAIEKIIIDIAIKEAEIAVELENGEKSDSQAFKLLCSRKAKNLERDFLILDRRLKTAISDRDQYARLLEEMYTTGEAYLPDGMDLKDAIQDPYIEAQLERDHWISRLGKQASMDILAYGQIGTGNLDAITQLNDSDAKEVLNAALVYSNQVKNELAYTERAILKEIGDSGTDTLDIHKMRTSSGSRELE